jgi:hypothetical protein
VDLDELGTFLLSKPQYRSKLLTGPLPEFLGTTEYLSTISTSLETQALSERSHRLDEERIQALESASQLTVELNQSRENTARLMEELNKGRKSTLRLKEKLSQALEEGRLAQNEAIMAQSSAINTEAELVQAQAKIAELEHLSDQRLFELKEIRASRSWALTSPYRKFASLIRGLNQ